MSIDANNVSVSVGFNVSVLVGANVSVLVGRGVNVEVGNGVIVGDGTSVEVGTGVNVRVATACSCTGAVVGVEVVVGRGVSVGTKRWAQSKACEPAGSRFVHSPASLAGILEKVSSACPEASKETCFPLAMVSFSPAARL